MTLRGRDKLTLAASEALAERCGVIRSILDVTGPPRWRSRPDGYAGLARIIIEQQLSVASANAILERVQAATNNLDAEQVLQVSQDDLKALGLSRPKIRYLKTLGSDVLEGRFCFKALKKLSDQEASEALEGLLGVGRWTAAVYLLFCENRRDLWPRADVALLAGHQMAGGKFDRSELKAFDTWAEDNYAPYRGTAAHILWGQIAHARGSAPL